MVGHMNRSVRSQSVLVIRTINVQTRTPRSICILIGLSIWNDVFHLHGLCENDGDLNYQKRTHPISMAVPQNWTPPTSRKPSVIRGIEWRHVWRNMKTKPVEINRRCFGIVQTSWRFLFMLDLGCRYGNAAHPGTEKWAITLRGTVEGVTQWHFQCL